MIWERNKENSDKGRYGRKEGGRRRENGKVTEKEISLVGD